MTRASRSAILGILFGLGILSCGGPKEGPPPSAAQRLNAEGIRMLDRGDEAGAEQMLKNALREGELVDDMVAEAESWNNLGALAMARGRPREAWADHATALRLYQAMDARSIGEVRTRANLGAALLGAGEAAEAKRQFEEAVALASTLGQPDAARLARVGLAAVALKSGDAARAREVAREVADAPGTTDPENRTAAWRSGALAVEGAAEEALGDRKSAHGAYERALQIDRARAAPRAVAEDLAGLARVAEASGNASEAGLLLTRRARVLRRLGNLDGAASDLERAIVLTRTTSQDTSQSLAAELAALRASRP